jgi:AraC-like DNA-binding protein
MTETTVAAALMIDLLEQLERRGVPAAELCRRARVDPGFTSRPHERIPGSWAERLWQQAEAASGDPLLGLHTAENYRMGATSILGYVFLNCRTGSEAIERLTRFGVLLNDGLRVHLARDSATTTIRLEAVPGIDNFLLRSGRHVIETMAAGIVLTLRRLVDRPTVPSEVWFRHRVAGPVEEYHRIFGTLVRFGQPEDRLAFRNEQVDLAIPAADPSLLALFEGHARVRLDELERLGGTSQRVVRLLAARLMGAVPPVGTIAAELAMSGRQLQRVLQAEGTTYQALLDEARRDLALARLRLPGTTAAEVALLLGYSEAGAFTRAFRRWTGTTPGAYAAGAAGRGAT